MKQSVTKQVVATLVLALAVAVVWVAPVLAADAGHG
ncbi:MAG: hypothetical protein RLZZ597_2677, partial [Cyanobacteriota bacterium]